MTDLRAVSVAPHRYQAVIFDLDGVITNTARVHAAAWKRLFDEYLATRAPADIDRGEFTDEDYVRHVDGRPRIDGVIAFLSSRRIELPRGDDADSPDTPTAWGLANRKNQYFLDALASEGVEVFPASMALLTELRSRGMATGVVTASRNRAQVLSAAGIDDLFDVHVDGVDAAHLNLAGKPDPATFLEAARRMRVSPERAVVVEDALSGVEAGLRGGFGLVIGVDRRGYGHEMLRRGADVVVDDLSAVFVPGEDANG